jgi:hypothetical protein
MHFTLSEPQLKVFPYTSHTNSKFNTVQQYNISRFDSDLRGSEELARTPAIIMFLRILKPHIPENTKSHI